MVIKELHIGKYHIKLFENLKNKNIVGRSVYSISLEEKGKGVFLRSISDNKEQAKELYVAIIFFIIASHMKEKEYSLTELVKFAEGSLSEFSALRVF